MKTQSVQLLSPDEHAFIDEHTHTHTQMLKQWTVERSLVDRKAESIGKGFLNQADCEQWLQSIHG